MEFFVLMIAFICYNKRNPIRTTGIKKLSVPLGEKNSTKVAITDTRNAVNMNGPKSNKTLGYNRFMSIPPIATLMKEARKTVNVPPIDLVPLYRVNSFLGYLGPNMAARPSPYTTGKKAAIIMIGLSNPKKVTIASDNG